MLRPRVASGSVALAVVAGVVSLAAGAQTAVPASPERARENAVTQAEDAFGISIGREELGLYGSDDIRGFSPVDAGNARIDGLYFDPYLRPNVRVRQATTIRVGITAQGQVFPAPTGVVDYQLRKPGEEAGASVLVNVDHWGGAAAEIDAVLPLRPGTLSLGAGAFFSANEFYNGTDSRWDNQGLTLRWTPTASLAIQPFWTRSSVRDDEAGPIYLPAGDRLPPRLPRRLYVGPDWAYTNSYGELGGATLRYALSDATLLEAGLFRSLFADARGAVNLALDIDAQGGFTQTVLIDPPSRYVSDSGELRLRHSRSEGPRTHQFTLSARARDRRQRYDGSARVELGARRLREPVDLPVPTLAFRVQSRDRIRQTTFGAAYALQWRGLGEIGVGLQRSDYVKVVERTDTGTRRNETQPWLPYLTLAAPVGERLALYGSYTEGLEESGVAPSNAINRGEPAPGLRTRQVDAGLRWRLGKDLKLIAGLFDLRKPNFSLDATNRFRELGAIRNQGLELSLSGALTPRLDLVAGGVFLRPRVTGDDVTTGLVGARPVGIAERNLTVNVDWRPTANPDFAVDLRVTHLSPVTATVNSRVATPSQTLFDLGTRLPLHWGDASGSLRLSVTNLFDREGFTVQGAGAYDLLEGRLFQARFTFDLK